ncbi:MAG: YscO family type III secretion system apparatus protein [Sulfitobacter sp.]|nr:YscO family type III secretion system apparatus protein [Sulfitobacter sp.]
MYDDLLWIKAHREQTASSEVLRQKHLVEERARELERSKADVERFHARRVEEEKQLFEDIRGQPVGLRDIDDMRQQADLLRGREAQLQSEVMEGKKRLQETQQGLEAARGRHREAVREHEKFKQLVAVQQEAEDLESIRREELELEEVVEAGYRTHADND